MEKLAVLSRYNENNHKFFDLIHRGYSKNIIIYDKGKKLNSNTIKLPNVGREGHTFLTYIVENYKNLPNEILFSQYDPMDHVKLSGSEKLKSFLLGDFIDFSCMNSTSYDEIVAGRYINWKSMFSKIFNKFSDEDYYRFLHIGTSINGIFKVKKEAILKHELDFYKKCLRLLDYHINPKEGFFFERAWKPIFFHPGSHKKNNIKNLIDIKIIPQEQNYFPDRLYSGDVKFKLRYKKNGLGTIYLHESGTIMSAYKNINFFSEEEFCYWSLIKNILYILDYQGCITCKFDLNTKNHFSCHSLSTGIIGDYYRYKSIHREKNKIENFFLINFI